MTDKNLRELCETVDREIIQFSNSNAHEFNINKNRELLVESFLYDKRWTTTLLFDVMIAAEKLQLGSGDKPKFWKDFDRLLELVQKHRAKVAAAVP